MDVDHQNTAADHRQPYGPLADGPLELGFGATDAGQDPSADSGNPVAVIRCQVDGVRVIPAHRDVPVAVGLVIQRPEVASGIVGIGGWVERLIQRFKCVRMQLPINPCSRCP
jgi:hypothetical protein